MFSISSSSWCCVLFPVPLKAKCSKKCAVPLTLSALEPASIQTPTVEVCAQGECSVAIVRPLDSVVDSVVAPWLTGVASPRRVLFSADKACRERRACGRRVMSLLDAIVPGVWQRERGGWYKERLKTV